MRPFHGLDSSISIVIPSPLALDSVRLHTNYGIEQLKPLIVATTSSDPPSDQSSRLLELPNEILLTMFRFLLPDGQVFHVTPTSKKKIRATSIHRLSSRGSPLPHASEDRLRGLPILSTVCRRLTDITYAVFFGENQFVFEIASGGITSHVRSVDHDLESWYKIVRTKPMGLSPLSQISARYLTNLTLCISLTGRHPGGYEWKCLRESLQRIVGLFQESKHELKMLSVHVGIAQRFGRRTDSNALEIDTTNGLHMRIRNDEVARRNIPAATIKTLANVVVPLMALEGVRETQISGLITNEMLCAHNEVNDDETKKRSAGDVSEHRSAKRQRYY